MKMHYISLNQTLFIVLAETVFIQIIAVYVMWLPNLNVVFF